VTQLDWDVSQTSRVTFLGEISGSSVGLVSGPNIHLEVWLPPKTPSRKVVSIFPILTFYIVSFYSFRFLPYPMT
jgi:hypothetical protein